ncbi:MAG: alpha-glucoside transport system substrate-binding protein [Chloroflexota bacterium]|jgi:alpha-glucoside transport system substrate-binding protein|nr:alpha-glucoside transport system substrate-binding protein [Chloroflexota bacterium]
MDVGISTGRRVATLLAATALVVAACGGSATPAPASSTGGAASTAPGSSGASGSSGAPAASLGQIGGSVSIVAVWSGGTDPKSEEYAFRQVLAPFTAATGVQINYTSTRDINAVLTTGVASGNLPDVAGLPGPGKVIELAGSGVLKPLDGVIDVPGYTADTPGAAALQVNGKQYAEFFKGSIKGLIWYDPKIYTGGAPTSWDDLQAKATAALGSLSGTKEWCIGLQSGPGADGWPGTDWIEDLVLRQSGPAVYDQWVAGKQKWTSAEIKAAWTEFGKAVSATYGDPTSIDGTNFGDAGNQLFKTPPGCLFHHQASFITTFFEKGTPGIKAGTDYDFFPFPDINPANTGAVTGGGDLLGMFNDTPQAKALMQYLITPQAQAIWPKIGGAISGSKSVPAATYPDDISKKSAAALSSAKIFRFDASDAMPVAMSDAFLKGILDFVKDQSKLDSILTNLDTVQTSAYGG